VSRVHDDAHKLMWAIRNATYVRSGETHARTGFANCRRGAGDSSTGAGHPGHFRAKLLGILRYLVRARTWELSRNGTRIGTGNTGHFEGSFVPPDRSPPCNRLSQGKPAVLPTASSGPISCRARRSVQNPADCRPFSTTVSDAHEGQTCNANGGIASQTDRGPRLYALGAGRSPARPS